MTHTQKKIAAVAASILILTGCNTTRLTSVQGPGQKFELVNNRFLWNSGSYAGSFSTNGLNFAATNSVESTGILQSVLGLLGATLK